MKTPSGAKLIDILRVIRSETQPIDGHPDPGAITDCWNEVFETISAIESKHTDQTEIQRLRAAAIKLHETINSFWQGDCDKADVVAAQSKLCDVLDSTGNHPKQVKPFQQRLLELTIEENKKIYNIPKGDENDA